ncbi:MAG: hypothetical protein A2010_08480 [Nitrospirae bacterium GWD2_57_9]|nr:MAG: hypothetical protein A2010_08480 [Nitrospirae bacterium GWD2_57_9]
MPEQAPKPKSKLEAPDIILLFGLIFIFIGSGLAISWPWALVITGTLLIGLAIWLVNPAKPRKDKA